MQRLRERERERERARERERDHVLHCRSLSRMLLEDAKEFVLPRGVEQPMPFLALYALPRAGTTKHTHTRYPSSRMPLPSQISKSQYPSTFTT